MPIMNLNSSPSPFPIEQIGYDHDHQHHQPFAPNYQVASSLSSSLSCHIFFGPTQDQTGSYQKDDAYAYQGGSSYEMKNKVSNGLKLTLWKKEDAESVSEKNNSPLKWMSSKMRLMQKMKNNPDCVALKINRNGTKTCEDQKVQPSSSLETDLSSNSSSYNNNSPIRVCADCNTTKTPLWRSGPKGPKSLCNACGIRQRKARRAMAVAASGPVVASDQTPTSLKIKVVQHKEKTTKNVHFKKRFKMAATAAAAAAAGSPSNGKKKIDLEDFLINLSNNLAFHRVFPEEEKDAAILLMALSSGLVHG
ncbi:hypothetical protein BUALT_Bualt09G0032300 [Buddleja alternifolia]|uniref:GATA-type domain-containing protein n=1 Tax=Buddleja alternifolia TaxID=168488 RepID=A0AAV6XAG7_9LAMI|nr:hypothetical protein BUALT_Bualt09G0032300 [Buddleja alternifolia]